MPGNGCPSGTQGKIVPLYCEAYSSEDKEYTDSTDKVIKIIDTVVQSIGTKGTWAIDRMGDNNEIIKCFYSTFF